MRIGTQYTYMLEGYITQLFQSQATLNEPATVNMINFQAVVKRKGLVRSSCSSTVELPIAITDRLRERSESPSAVANVKRSVQHELLSSLESVALQYSCREKRDINFSDGPLRANLESL